MKSRVEVKRLFMIDIVERGKKEIELILHFINKEYSPWKSPQIKKYIMPVDENTQEFLVMLEQEVMKSAEYYLANKPVEDY